jgi:hypothetical protein
MLKNRISDHEFEIAKILSSLCYHIHPDIINVIQLQNQKDFPFFEKIFAGRVPIACYLYPGSACVFPGVKRYVSGQGEKRKYNESYQAIIDDNVFPRHLWSYLATGNGYSGPSWKSSGLSDFELAHVFTHKESELKVESSFFDFIEESLLPYGDFTCACNVVLLPKGCFRPTDTSLAIKSVFYKRYIDLYGEEPLKGRKKFREKMAPDWYPSLKWNEPVKPEKWETRISKLLGYRRDRIETILGG